MMGRRQDPRTSGGQIDGSWWAALAGRLLHPVQFQIIEALRWIERPLSAGDLYRIFDEEPTWPAFVHHVRRLSVLGAIAFVEEPLAEKALRTNPLDAPYQLAAPEKATRGFD
jgi:hypothetical protein